MSNQGAFEMTDCELLKWAAKAAGVNLACGVDEHGAYEENWNPLTDDGDALRLAVKLSLTIEPYPIYEPDKHSVIVSYKKHADCPNAAPPLRYCAQCSEPCQLKPAIASIEQFAAYETISSSYRRAIVRAAAEIGKAMP